MMDAVTLIARCAMSVGTLMMIVGAKKCRSGAAWAHLVAVVGVVVTLGSAGWCLADWQKSDFDPETDRLYQQVAACKLGAYLAEAFPGHRALIIVDPAYPRNAPAENPVLQGLREGLGRGITIHCEYTPEISRDLEEGFVDGPPEEGGRLPPEERTAMIPPDVWYTSEVFDNIADRFGSKVDIIVSTIGLPANPAEMDFWGMEKRPELALVGSGVWNLKTAIQQGAVCAAVADKPDAKYSGRRPPSDLDTAFSKRYVLVTSENVADMANRYGTKLFR